MSELYELPDGWEWKKLGDLAKYLNGMAFKPTDWAESGFPIIRIQNLNGSDNYNYFNGEAKDRYYVKDGDILISWSASLDVYKWSGGNAILNQHIFNTDINLDVVNYDFFYHTIKYSLAEIMKNLHGVGMKHITKGKFENIDLPLPPLPEQQRIVSKLDLLFEKIDKSIALHQKNMDEANVFMGSVLNDVFGELEEKYEIVAVGTITDCIVPQRNKPKQFIGDIQWITTDDLILFSRVFKSSKGLGLRTEEIKESQSKIIPKESVLMSCVGYLGMVSIADVEMVVNQQLHTFQCSESINNKFLMYALYVKQKYMYSIANITTVAYMNKSKCNSIPIPLPPLPIQQKTVKYLDEISEKIEKIKSVQKEKMDSLKALKASILDSAFRGEL